MIADKLVAGGVRSFSKPLSVLLNMHSLKSAGPTVLDAVALDCATSHVEWKAAPAVVRKAAAVSFASVQEALTAVKAESARARTEAQRAAGETTLGVEWRRFSSSITAACDACEKECVAVLAALQAGTSAYDDIAFQFGVDATSSGSGSSDGPNVFLALKVFSEMFERHWEKAKRIAARGPAAAASSGAAKSAVPSPTRAGGDAPRPSLQAMLNQRFASQKAGDDDDSSSDDEWKS